MTAVVQIAVLVDLTAGNLTKLQLAGCGYFLTFLTVADRNKCLAGAGITIAQLKENYPSVAQNQAIDAEALNGQVLWADSGAPTVAEYYMGCYNVDNTVDGRITGWLNANTQKWIKCDWSGKVLLYDSCGSEITGMPSPGTEVQNCVQLLRLSGFVPVDGLV